MENNNQDTGPSPDVPAADGPSVPSQPETSAGAPVFAPVGVMETKKKSPKKLILLILAAVLVLGGGVFAWLMMQDKEADQAAMVQVVEEIDQLRIASTAGPANVFFPLDAAYGFTIVGSRQVYEGLTGFEDSKVTPLLAESWTNPDERTWVFKLKPNVKFQTGKTLTAQDVKANLESLKDYDFWSIFVSTIDTVEATGDLEVKITTAEPDSLLLNRLSTAFIMDLEAPEDAPGRGTGAYMLDAAAENNEQSVTLVPFDDYHGGRAKTRKVVYTVYDTEEAARKAMLDGEADVLDVVSSKDTQEAMETAGFESKELDSPGVFGLYLNTLRPDSPLASKEVRAAIAQILDREAYINDLESVGYRPTAQSIPKVLPGHDSAITVPKPDPEAGKRALTEAGYVDGTELHFLYMPGLQPDAPVIVKQLREAGLNIIEQKAGSIPEMVQNARSGNFDMFAAAYNSDFFDARDLLGALVHSTESTYPVVKDPAFDKLLNDSDREFDAVKRVALLQQANQYIHENTLWVPLRSTFYVSYHKPGLYLNNDFVGGVTIGAYFKNAGRLAERPAGQ